MLEVGSSLGLGLFNQNTTGWAPRSSNKMWQLIISNLRQQRTGQQSAPKDTTKQNNPVKSAF